MLEVIRDVNSLETLEKLNNSKSNPEHINNYIKIKVNFIKNLIEFLYNNIDHATAYLIETNVIAIDFEICNNDLILTYYIDTVKLNSFLNEIGYRYSTNDYIEGIMESVYDVIFEYDFNYKI